MTAGQNSMVAARTFRDDLFYQLRGYAILGRYESADVAFDPGCQLGSLTFHVTSSRFPSVHGLVEILRRPEGKTLEFKRGLSGPRSVLKTIVAFSNTVGGTLLLGVEDGSHHVRGVRDLGERLANLVSDRNTPRLVPEIEILPWRRTQVLAVQVPARSGRTGSPGRRLSAGRMSGWARRTVVPTPRWSRSCVALRGAMGSTISRCPGSTLKPSTSESFAAVRKLARRDLETLRLVTDHQGRKVPTVGEMLLFGARTGF